jgi:hypothetical protein
MISGMTGQARLEPGSEQPVDIRLQIPLGAQAHDLSRHLARFEKQQRRNSPHPIFGRQRLLLVNIDFADADAAVLLAGNFLQQRGDHFAGAAPLGPEIDHHGAWNAEDLLGKIGLVEFNHILRGHSQLICQVTLRKGL